MQTRIKKHVGDKKWQLGVIIGFFSDFYSNIIEANQDDMNKPPFLRKIRLLWAFYKQIFFVSMVINLIALSIFYRMVIAPLIPSSRIFCKRESGHR